MESGLEPLDAGWLVFEELSPAECKVLASLDGERSLEDLAETLRIDREEVELSLRRLASRLVIE